MSYEKVKFVSFTHDNRIIIDSASNNVRPIRYEKKFFNGTTIDFIKNLSGNVFQITPSANNYFWSVFLPTFKKVLLAVNIDYDNLYSLDNDNPRWDDIIDIFYITMGNIKANRGRKYRIKDGAYYLMDKVNDRYNLTTKIEKAKVFTYYKARYISEKYGYNLEEI